MRIDENMFVLPFRQKTIFLMHTNIPFTGILVNLDNERTDIFLDSRYTGDLHSLKLRI